MLRVTTKQLGAYFVLAGALGACGSSGAGSAFGEGAGGDGTGGAIIGPGTGGGVVGGPDGSTSGYGGSGVLDPDAACVSNIADSRPITSDIFIMLDKSGSMNCPAS